MLISWLKTQAYAFASAVRFLSVIPLPQLPGEKERDWRQDLISSLFFYPTVGLLLGFIFVLLAEGFQGIFQPALLAVILLTVWICLSGALHLDGLADCADACVGGLGSSEKTLMIMKDPACGPVGVSAIVVVLLLKFSALQELVSSGLPNIYLLLPPLLGRYSIVLMRLTTPYVREGGIGEDVFKLSPVRPLIIQSLIVLISIIYFFPGVFVGLFSLLALVFFFVRRACISRLTGCTGDVLGALVELIEVATLVALCLYF